MILFDFRQISLLKSNLARVRALPLNLFCLALLLLSTFSSLKSPFNIPTLPLKCLSDGQVHDEHVSGHGHGHDRGRLLVRREQR